MSDERESEEQREANILQLLNDVLEAAMYCVNDVCWNVTAMRRDQLAASLGVSVEQLIAGQRRLGLLMMTMVFPVTVDKDGQPVEWSVTFIVAD